MRLRIFTAAIVASPLFLLGQPSRQWEAESRAAGQHPIVQAAHTLDVAVGPGFSFSPSILNVSVGDTVRWTWSSSNHSVTAGNCCMADNNFCSPNDTLCVSASTSNTGAVYSHTFNQPGSFPYFCKIHGSNFGMVGTINVTLPLVVTSVSRPTGEPTPGQFVITGTTTPNLSVTIKASQSLTGFIAIGSATADVNGNFHFEDPDAATIQPALRFYRVVYP